MAVLGFAFRPRLVAFVSMAPESTAKTFAMLIAVQHIAIAVQKSLEHTRLCDVPNAGHHTSREQCHLNAAEGQQQSHWHQIFPSVSAYASASRMVQISPVLHLIAQVQCCVLYMPMQHVSNCLSLAVGVSCLQSILLLMCCFWCTLMSHSVIQAIGVTISCSAHTSALLA